MPGMARYTGSVSPATATGLTQLDTVTAVSVGFWYRWGGVAGNIFLQAVDTAGKEGFRLGVQDAVGTLRLSVGDAAGSENLDSAVGHMREKQWHHYGVAWAVAGGADPIAGSALFYRNGQCLSRVASTKVPTTGGTRTTAIGPAVLFEGRIFDLQWHPGVVLTHGEFRAMMDPRRLQQTGARWFRYWKPGASAIIYDEGTLAANLTASSTALACDSCEEPPWRSTVFAWRKAQATAGAGVVPFNRSVLAGGMHGLSGGLV